MPPETPRQPQPVIIDQTFARTVQCNLLYDQFRILLGTNKVYITVQAIYQPDGTELTKPTMVPQVGGNLYDVCEKGYSHYLIKVDYTAGKLLPDTKMTRAEFLIELLDIWQTMRDRLGPHLDKTVGANLDLVMEHTRSIYAVAELVDLTYMEEGK